MTIISGKFSLDTVSGQLTGQADGSTPVPPDPIPPTLIDQIPMEDVTIVASPDVKGWAIGASMTKVGLDFQANQVMDFTKKNGPNAWPFVIGSEGGEIQFTLWVVLKINGQWMAVACIRCISRAPNDNYVPTGPTLVPGQLPNNWYYFAPWPVGGYQPQPGEPVGWFLTSGDQRRGDIHTIMERTNIVVTPFSPGLFSFPV